jgi:hypothetical protein
VTNGVPNIKIVKKLSIKVQTSQKSIYSIPTLFKLIFGPKREKIGWVHFPLGFRGKNFKSFRNFFLTQNYIKRYFRYWVFPHENGGPVYTPIRHTEGLEKILPKFRNNPQMGKLVIVPGRYTYWGWGAGPNKVPYHSSTPYKYWLLTLRQKEVMF